MSRPRGADTRTFATTQPAAATPTPCLPLSHKGTGPCTRIVIPLARSAGAQADSESGSAYRVRRRLQTDAHRNEDDADDGEGQHHPFGRQDGLPCLQTLLIKRAVCGGGAGDRGTGRRIMECTSPQQRPRARARGSESAQPARLRPRPHMHCRKATGERTLRPAGGACVSHVGRRTQRR